MQTFKSLVGQVFGRLTVVDRAENKGRRIAWNCVCECGKPKIATTADLRRGSVRSCGCLAIERGRLLGSTIHLTHGESRHGRQTAEYTTWQSMIARCTPGHACRKQYFNRGITVCERWLNSFEDFLADMGRRPLADEHGRYSLDRRDNNKGYSPENCRWATHSEQQSNKAGSRYLTARGETKTVSEWLRETGITRTALMTRLRLGWDVEAALFTPVKQYRFS